MEKTIYSKGYLLLIERLRNARENLDLSQTELADRMGQSQSFVSKSERGERRIDIVELHAFCHALDIPFVPFIAEIENTFGSKK